MNKKWAYCIAASQARSYGEGFIIAESPTAALAKLGHPDANVYPVPDDTEFGHLTPPI